MGCWRHERGFRVYRWVPELSTALAFLGLLSGIEQRRSTGGHFAVSLGSLNLRIEAKCLKRLLSSMWLILVRNLRDFPLFSALAPSWQPCHGFSVKTLHLMCSY